ncbi:MAG: MmgE/PrpD family protein [Nitrospinae bacterium]|nr:MmgE/PrpD family protein [Nitrospinota bacterium]
MLSTPNEAMCQFSRDLEFADIPPAVVHQTKLLILDFWGIALAACSMEIDKPLRVMVNAITGRIPSRQKVSYELGTCSAIAEKNRMPAPNAAFLNGALGHSLDFDDTHAKSIIHTAAPVVPVAFAGAETFQKAGQDMIRACVAGFESEIRIGLAAPGKFHARGFHMTAIAGTFGAAIAYALQSGLSIERMSWALGICGSMAAGLFEYLENGSPVKALHPGWAAHGGICSTILANNDFAGPLTVFEGRFGLLKSHLGDDEFEEEALTRGLGVTWETLSIGFKPYPCGHVIHAFLDAGLRLKKREKIHHTNIKKVICHAAKGAIDLVLDPIEVKRKPRGEYDAKFSLPYCLASIFVKGKCGVDDFEKSAIADPTVLTLADKVSYIQDDTQDFPRYFPGAVEVQLDDGSTFIEEEKHQRGCAENPFSDEDVFKKFKDNARRSLSHGEVEDLMAMLMALESLENVNTIGEILRSAASHRVDPQSPSQNPA